MTLLAYIQLTGSKYRFGAVSLIVQKSNLFANYPKMSGTLHSFLLFISWTHEAIIFAISTIWKSERNTTDSVEWNQNVQAIHMNQQEADDFEWIVNTPISIHWTAIRRLLRDCVRFIRFTLHWWWLSCWDIHYLHSLPHQLNSNWVVIDAVAGDIIGNVANIYYIYVGWWIQKNTGKENKNKIQNNTSNNC